MNTKPIDTILTREITEEVNKDYCNKASEYLKKMVDFSTQMFHLFSLQTKEKFGENECVSIAMQLLHCTEIMDSIQELSSIGLFNPCTFYVRSLFEIYLSLRLLLEDEELFIDRSLTWLFFSAKQNIKVYREFESGSIEKINLVNEIQINFDQKKYKETSREKIDNLINLLNRSQFDVIRQKFNEYKRLPNNWYQLVDKTLSNTRELAKKFNNELEYIFIYNRYSVVIHGTDYQRFMKRMSPNFENKYILRDRSLIKEIPGYAGNWMLSIFNMVFHFFLPEKIGVLKEWYLNEIKSYTKDIWSEQIEFE